MFFVLMIVAAIAAMIITVLPKYYDVSTASSSGKKKPTKAGWLFMACVIIALVASVWGVVVQKAASSAQLERHRVLIEKMQKAALEELERHSRVIERIRQESLRLVPSDFQIRLTSSTRNNIGETSLPSFKPIHIQGTLGEAEFICELVEVGDHLQENVMVTDPGFYGLTGDPRAYGGALEAALDIRYYAHNLTFTGLERYPHLYDLHGVWLKVRLPLEKLDIRDTYWKHTADFYVKGRHFSATADSIGFVSFVLKFEDEVP